MQLEFSFSFLHFFSNTILCSHKSLNLTINYRKQLGIFLLHFLRVFSHEESQILLYCITFKMSPDTLISIPVSSSSFHFSMKLNYTCKLPNCFSLYGISNKLLPEKETFCSSHILNFSCMTQQQLSHVFPKILYILFFPLFCNSHKYFSQSCSSLLQLT